MNHKSVLDRVIDTFLVILMLLVIVVCAFPFWNQMVLSVAEMEQLYSIDVVWYPKTINLGSYRAMLEYTQLWRGYANTILRTVLGTFLCLLTTALMAYPLSKKDLPFNKFVTTILKVGDQWYVFYHGSSNNSKYTRRARVERIEVDEINGYIRTAEMTSSGFAPALNPAEELAAAYGYRVWGGAYFTERDGCFPLVNVKNGAAVAYRYYDFGEKATWQVTLRCRCLSAGQLLFLVQGEEMAQMPVDGSSGRVISAELPDLSGLAEVKIVFKADHAEDILELESIRFDKR